VIWELDMAVALLSLIRIATTDGSYDNWEAKSINGTGGTL